MRNRTGSSRAGDVRSMVSRREFLAGASGAGMSFSIMNAGLVRGSQVGSKVSSGSILGASPSHDPAFPLKSEQAGQPSSLRKTVYAFYPAASGTWNTQSIQWRALTHICFRTVIITEDGSLRAPLVSPPREFLQAAHDNGVKVTVLVWVLTQQDSDSYIAHHQAEAVNSLLAYVQASNLDGVCFDDEHERATNGATCQPSGPLWTSFFELLYSTFKKSNPNYHVAYAAPPVISSKDRSGVAWLEWDKIANLTDAIIPMIYAANPVSIGWTTNPEPLAGGGSGPGVVPRDVETLMADLLAATGGNKSKLLLGVASLGYAGYEFRAQTNQRLSPTLGIGFKHPPSYMEAQAQIYGKQWDPQQQSVWYVYPEGNHFVQGWYDDSRAWLAKLNYVNQQGLGGVGIWVLDGQNDPPQMWEDLRTTFDSPLR